MANLITTPDGWLVPSRAPYVIAEIGVNHNGDLDLARQCIEAAAACGVDAVKFQMFKAEEEVSDPTLTYNYERGGERQEENLLEMFRKLETPADWPSQLAEAAKAQGADFLSSVADDESVDRFASLNPPAVKIASCDLTYTPLLGKVGMTRLPVILSTGMASIREIEAAVDALRAKGCPGIMLLHCVSLYPTPDSAANLSRIAQLSEHFGCEVGYSDHTLGIEACVAATALGAVLLEKHFTIDRSLPGPDQELSSTPDELKQLVSSARRVAVQLGRNETEYSDAEDVARQEFRRSIVARVEIPAGTQITREMLAFRRPGTGLAPDRLPEIVGRTTAATIAVNGLITSDLLR